MGRLPLILYIYIYWEKKEFLFVLLRLQLNKVSWLIKIIQSTRNTANNSLLFIDSVIKACVLIVTVIGAENEIGASTSTFGQVLCFRFHTNLLIDLFSLNSMEFIRRSWVTLDSSGNQPRKRTQTSKSLGILFANPSVNKLLVTVPTTILERLCGTIHQRLSV